MYKDIYVIMEDVHDDLENVVTSMFYPSIPEELQRYIDSAYLGAASLIAGDRAKELPIAVEEYETISQALSLCRGYLDDCADQLDYIYHSPLVFAWYSFFTDKLEKLLWSESEAAQRLHLFTLDLNGMDGGS